MRNSNNYVKIFLLSRHHNLNTEAGAKDQGEEDSDEKHVSRIM